MSFWCKLETELAAWGKLGTFEYVLEGKFSFYKAENGEGAFKGARTMYTMFSCVFEELRVDVC